MSVLSRARSLMRNLLRKKQVEHELDEELSSYLDLLADEKSAAGLSREDALRAARFELGGMEPIKERVRDVRLGRLLEELWQDLRHGARWLRRSPGFTTVVALTLALGIGANTALFSVVHAVLLRPLPYPQPEKLVFIQERGATFGPMSISYPNYLDWRRETERMDEIAIWRRDSFNLTGQGEPERVRVAMISANLFRTLGARPIRGREFDDEEDRPGAEGVAVVSHDFSRQRFGTTSEAIGKPVTLDGRPYLIVGVMPPSFSWPSRVDVWVPIGPFSDHPGWQNRGNHPGIFGVGRMKPNVSFEEASAEIDAIAARLAREYPDSNEGIDVIYRPLASFLVRDLRSSLLVLFGAVVLVLAVACANVASLQVARSAVRRRELAVRTALGGRRLRLVRQLLTESALLASIGGMLGVLLAHWGIRIILAFFAGELPSGVDVSVDAPVLAFSTGLTVLTGLLFGLLPAWQASRADLLEAIQEGGRGQLPGRKRQRLNQALVVSEVALALILLVSAGLLFRSFALAAGVDPGFRAEGTWTAQISLPESTYREPGERARFHRDLLARLEDIPGVEGVATTDELPILGGSQTSFAVSGRPMPPPSERPFAEYSVVSPGYFEVMGIRLRRGRVFTERDELDAPGVVMIDASFADRHWAGENPVGQRIVLGPSDTEEFRYTVIGIVNDVRYDGLDVDPPLPQIYFSGYQVPRNTMTLLVRAPAEPPGLAESVRRAVHEEDPRLPLYDLQTMESVVGASLSARRMNLALLGVFAGLALLLSAIGIYGVVAYSVAQRRQELGIRVAFGARRIEIFRLVLGQGLRLAAAGAVIGLAGSLGLTRFLEGLLFRVDPIDAPTFIGVAVVLVGTTLGASFLPARRATCVDPVTALRHE